MGRGWGEEQKERKKQELQRHQRKEAEAKTGWYFVCTYFHNSKKQCVIQNNEINKNSLQHEGSQFQDNLRCTQDITVKLVAHVSQY